MRKAFLVLALSIAVLLLAASCTTPFAPGKDYSYTLELVDGKVISPDCPWVYCIEKTKGQDFTILNFADVQLSNSRYREQNGKDLAFFIETSTSMVKRFHPDLITLTGDQAYGETNMLTAVSNVVDSFNTDWAPVFGNHDNEQRQMTLKAQSELYRSYDNCLFMDGPSGLARIQPTKADAIGNYVINIVEIEGDSFRVVKSLIFFNSGNEQTYKSSDYEGQMRYHEFNYAALSEEQIHWYEGMVQSVQPYGEDGKVSSGVILHIPPYVFLEAAAAAYKSDTSIFDVAAWEKKFKEISFEESYDPQIWNEGYEGSFGMMHEPYGGTPYDEGFFDAVKSLGSTDFILAGHEHVNNYCINYEGVQLVYGMKTGTGSYFESDVLGGTIITIADDGSVTIRHELDHQYK